MFIVAVLFHGEQTYEICVYLHIDKFVYAIV